MRVVGGHLGGRRLHAPADPAVRPTADRVREALFSMLGDVTGLAVLDVFAGSGALGIEALSRGAASADFVDSGRRSIEAVRRNLLELEAEGGVYRRDALGWLAAAAGTRAYDLVFCDPPYDSAACMARPLAERLPAVLSESARIVTESDKRAPLELPFPLLRERIYGDTRIAIHSGG